MSAQSWRKPRRDHSLTESMDRGRYYYLYVEETRPVGMLLCNKETYYYMTPVSQGAGKSYSVNP